MSGLAYTYVVIEKTDQEHSGFTKIEQATVFSQPLKTSRYDEKKVDNVKMFSFLAVNTEDG